MYDVLKDKTQSEINSLKRRQSLFDKVLKSGKDITEIQLLSKAEYNKLMGTNIKTKKSHEAQLRVLEQINQNIRDVSIYHSDKNKIKDKQYRSFIDKRGRELFKKEGQYTIVEIKYKTESRWVKYGDKVSYLKQIQELEASYGDEYELIFYDYKKYAEFIEADFRKTIKIKGITI